MKKFVIPSLIAAGFAANSMDAAAIGPSEGYFKPEKTFLQKLRLEHLFTLARHSSHSSHASHASHASHRSSTHGGVTPRATPLYVAPTPLYTAPTTPRVLPGNSAKFTEIATKVQLALRAYGYYDGPIDGIIGKGAKEALRNYQAAYSLKVTGTVTPEVLDSLNIVAK